MACLVFYLYFLHYVTSSVKPEHNFSERTFGIEKALHNYLLDGYQTGSRPVRHASQSIRVNISVGFNQILTLDDRGQVLKIIASVDQEWIDDFLRWNPDDFEGFNSTCLPFDKVWKPDIVLYNSVGNQKDMPYMESHVCVDYRGQVRWFPLAKLQTSCQLDVLFYPFDYQTCKLRIGSWAYSVDQVDVHDDGMTGPDSNDFIDNGEFELVDSRVERQESHYNCCPKQFSFLEIKMLLKRRPLFTLLTLSTPCTLLSLMTVIAFILPPGDSAKIDIQLSVMLSLAVFTLLIGEHLPPTSNIIPLIGLALYLACLSAVAPTVPLEYHHFIMISPAVYRLHMVILMTITAFSLVCSVIVLYIVDNSHVGVPLALKKKALFASRLFRVKAPEHLIKKLNQDVNTNHQTYTNNVEMTDEDGQSQTSKGSQSQSSESSQSHSSNRQPSLNKLGVMHSSTKPHNDSCAIGLLSSTKDNLDLIVQWAQEERLKGDFRSEWIFLAAVIDRVLLVVLMIVALCATITIYAVCPLLQSSTL